jgi:hypothetical protein
MVNKEGECERQLSSQLADFLRLASIPARPDEINFLALN